LIAAQASAQSIDTTFTSDWHWTANVSSYSPHEKVYGTSQKLAIILGKVSHNKKEDTHKVIRNTRENLTNSRDIMEWKSDDEKARFYMYKINAIVLMRSDLLEALNEIVIGGSTQQEIIYNLAALESQSAMIWEIAKLPCIEPSIFKKILITWNVDEYTKDIDISSIVQHLWRFWGKYDYLYEERYKTYIQNNNNEALEIKKQLLADLFYLEHIIKKHEKIEEKIQYLVHDLHNNKDLIKEHKEELAFLEAQFTQLSEGIITIQEVAKNVWDFEANKKEMKETTNI